ncbi:MAG: acyltransferase family protein, partial [Mucinivorans sp.]
MINSSTQINRNRIVYFDILRGVAILLVIGIHTYNGGADLMNVFFRSLLNCAVPVFFAIAGFFAINNKTGLSQKIARVYIPTLLWS